MTSFLDTSVLVPVFLADHPHHAASIALFSTCKPETASCAGHSLAEVYSTLTRIPAPHRASPEQAIQCVEEIAARLRLISLDGAATLIATCALQSKPDRIYSWNTRHFERLGQDVALRLITP